MWQLTISNHPPREQSTVTPTAWATLADEGVDDVGGVDSGDVSALLGRGAVVAQECVTCAPATLALDPPGRDVLSKKISCAAGAQAAAGADVEADAGSSSTKLGK